MKNLMKTWDEFGTLDPLWSIFVTDETKGNRWNIDEFFKSGQGEMDGILRTVKRLGCNVKNGKALDFGCGVGRVTQAMANYFDEVHGVDIAPSMIDLANKYLKNERCKYYVNYSDDLELFDSLTYDFIYSSVVLQHIEPRIVKRYLREFLRILKYDGIIVFQLPSEVSHAAPLKYKVFYGLPLSIRRFCYKVIKMVRRFPIMEVYAIRKNELIEYLKDNEAKVVDIVQDGMAGPGWVSYRYCISK